MKHLTAGWFVLTLAACGDADESQLAERDPYPVPGCEALDHTPCDARALACQERMFLLAACLRGEAPGERPVVTVITQAQYAEYLNAYYADAGPRPNPDHWEQAMTLLGLAAPDAFSVDTRIDESVNRVWGIYRWETKDILVIDHGDDTPDEWSSALLIHEYVHALQDRGVDLQKFQSSYGTYDAALATDGVVEGEAELHETRYAASMLGLDPATVDLAAYFQARVDEHEEQMLDTESPYTASWSMFPYSLGGRYMHFTWREGGLDAVLQRFVSPPTTTQVVMASVEGAAQMEFTAVEPETLALRASSRRGETVLGAWGTFLVLLRELNDVEQARALALGWRGDVISVYGSVPADDPASETTLVWRLELADGPTAQQVATALGGDAAGVRVEVRRSNGAQPLSADAQGWPRGGPSSAAPARRAEVRSNEVEPLGRVLAHEALHRRHDLLCGPVELLGVGPAR